MTNPASTPDPNPETPASIESNQFATGTLAHAALPGAAFHPGEFDIEVSPTSLAGADELLRRMLEEALREVNGTRAFLALVDTLSGELADTPMRIDPNFGFEVPWLVEGLPKRLLDPRANWTDAAAYDIAAACLAKMFEGNMRTLDRPAAIVAA